MIWVWILLALVGLYVLFGLMPGIVMAYMTFAPRKTVCFDENPTALKESPALSPYTEQILADIAWMRAQPCERIEISAKDGTALRADLFARNAGRTAVLVHGFAVAPLNNYASAARTLMENGWDVLLVYQRAHGVSGGKTFSLGVQEGGDVLCWLDEMVRRNPAKPLMVWGISAGATAVMMASDRFPAQVCGMVADCGFTRPKQQMKRECDVRHAPFWMLSAAIEVVCRVAMGFRISSDVVPSLAACQTPAIFIHGTGDTKVPFTESERAFAAAACKDKQLIPVEGAGHTAAFPAMRDAQKAALIEQFDQWTNKHQKKTEDEQHG